MFAGWNGEENFAEQAPLVCATTRFGAGARVFGRVHQGYTVRRERRLSCDREVKLQVLTGIETDTTVPGQLKDISGRGIRFHTSQPLNPRQRFSITLKTGQGRCALFYVVRRVEQLADGWDVAAESLGVLGKDGADRPEQVILALMTGEQ